MTAGIEIEGLSFERPGGGFSLRVEHLALAPGQATALIGPSGAGKTTLVHLLAGILTPTAGRIRVGTTEVSALGDKDRRRFRSANLGIIFQEFELLDHLTVRENLLLPAYVTRAHGRRPALEQAAVRLAGALGIAGSLGVRPRRLSHGERQRVAIGRALVTEPPWILADEPTGNLDPDNARAMLDLAFAEVARRGAGLLMVTHDHGLLGRFDRVVDLRDVGGGGGA